MKQPANATFDDVNLILKLYDLRREPRLREARRWFTGSFKARTLDDFNALCPAGVCEGANAPTWPRPVTAAPEAWIFPELNEVHDDQTWPSPAAIDGWSPFGSLPLRSASTGTEPGLVSEASGWKLAPPSVEMATRTLSAR